MKKKIILLVLICFSFFNNFYAKSHISDYIKDFYYTLINNAFENIKKFSNYYKESNKCKIAWEKTNLFPYNMLLSLFHNQERTAIHEAGHLVAAKQLGCYVPEVYLHRNLRGFTYYPHAKNLEQKIIIDLSGYITETLIFGNAHDGCNQDITRATARILQLHNIKFEDHEKIKQLLSNYKNQSKEIISKNLHIVIKFAQILLSKPFNSKNTKNIYGDEIDQIYNELTQSPS